MKKLSILFLAFAGVINLHSQIRVFSTGKVGIVSTAAYSPLTIGNTNGNTGSEVFILGKYVPSSNVYGLLAYSSATDNNYTSEAIAGFANFNSGGATSAYKGVLGYAYSGTAVNYGRSYGVYGVAGNTAYASGYNYGYNYAVYGWLSGTKCGAAVYGSLTGTDQLLYQRYAGFFDGQVYVNGTLYVSGIAACSLGVWSSSDSLLKHDILEINKTTLNSLFKLNGVSYKYNSPKPSSPSIKSDTSTIISTEATIGDSSIYNKILYGYIAQDVEKIYPDLVYTDKSGLKMINYDSFIPLIIETLKEQNKTIDTLKIKMDTLKLSNDFMKQQISSCCDRNSLKSMTALSEEESSIRDAVLYQNMPNPFSDKTEIKYYLPSTSLRAMLCVYDMQGKQLKCYNIAGQGENSLTINGNELSAGMYLYTLIVNGKEIDTKRMILTN